MRTHLNAATALLLTALMLTSLLAIQQPVPVEVLSDEDLNQDEPLYTSGRSAATLLASGSGTENEDGEHIESLPNGGWVIGSEFLNTTLSYGTQTLSPSSPYNVIGLGEFFLAIICLLYTSPSPRDTEVSRMPSSA